MTRRNTQRGFSFIEMLVTIAIFVVVSGIMINGIIFFYRSNAFALEQAFAVNSARRGIEVMVRDIREASYSEEGRYPIVSIDTNDLTIYSDIDRDDDVERVRFFLSTTTEELLKVVTSSTGTPPTYVGGTVSTSTIATDVRNEADSVDMFTYYTNSTSTLISTFDDVTQVGRVQVDVIVNINPLRLPNEFTIRSSAALRNLRPSL